MDVRAALKARKSTRAFLEKEVGVDTVERILEAASYAPSGVNTQPWQVAVVMGERKHQLEQLIEGAFRNGEKGEMDYQYYPRNWQGAYKERRKQCGQLLYSVLGITREDKKKRIEQWAANYRAFDAPVVLFFFMDPILETGSYLDYGMFLQSVMLAAVEEGLATCPQAALGEYPKIVKEHLDYPQDSILICGMAMGYEDLQATVNSYRLPRESVATFTRFF